MNTEKFEIIAKTFQGLEDVLAQEIITLGGEEVEIGKRMVSFVGDKEMLYKANLHLRTALRILKPIHTFTASNTDEVYEFLKTIKWEDFITESQTFSIDSVVFSDNFRHSKFVTYRVKDAIADYFQEKYEKRPSVRLTNADLSINLHIAGLTCTLSLDSSGESLHKRGYRVDQNDAPLNEVLAAGMILKSGWNGDKNFFDPMCGSGTLLIEAAMIATNTPPGIYRQSFAFEKWRDYDEELFDKLYNDETNEREFEFKIIGSDISPRAIEIASENIKSAGFSRFVFLKTMPFQNYTTETAPKDCTMMMNPPYGERISSRDILGLYELIGTTLKHQFKGTDAWILSYREECFEMIGLRPSLKFDLMNGGLDCEFRKYEIFEGGLKDFKAKGGEFDKETLDLELDGDNRMKRQLRKDRFTGNDRGGRKGRPDSNRGPRPERRESTFKKFDRSDRKPFERREGDGERGQFDRSDRKPFERRDGERRSFDRSDRKPFERRDGERRSFDRSDRKPFERRDGERRSFDRSDRKPFERRDSERRSFDRSDRKPFERRDGERRQFDREDRGERRQFGKYDQSGNFKRNSEGKLELRTDGEFKPRGERTFNPNRPRFFQEKKEENSQD